VPRTAHAWQGVPSRQTAVQRRLLTSPPWWGKQPGSRCHRHAVLPANWRKGRRCGYLRSEDCAARTTVRAAWHPVPSKCTGLLLGRCGPVTGGGSCAALLLAQSAPVYHWQESMSRGYVCNTFWENSGQICEIVSAASDEPDLGQAVEGRFTGRSLVPG